MRHLNDQDLQAYLDRETSPDGREVERHLQTCRSCQNSLAAYKRLYSGLGNETGFMLSANFSDAVVAKIENRGDSKFNLLETGLLIIAIIASLAAALYFTDLGQLFIDLFRQGRSGLSSMLSNLPFLQGGSLHIFIFAAVILSAIGLLDKMIFQIKHR